MVIQAFPPVESADEHGLVAVGGDVEPESLLLAYRSGIFPWPFSEAMLSWFAPPKRALLFLDKVKIPRSLKKLRRSSTYEVRFNTQFETVMRSCAQSRNRSPGQGTWITDELVQGYCDLHRRGFVHSVECFEGKDLVGGLYGVAIGAMFAGESMFYTKANASKLALYTLVEHLQQKGANWIDCQVLTPTLAGFGAEEIPRAEFMKLLRQEIKRDIKLF